MRRIRTPVALCLAGFLFLEAPSALAQGSLAPPGAPAPSMKSLDQVASTGIAIDATNTPGDANHHFIINQAGSYFLTGNLGVTKTNGIRVNVAGVTIDLNGFEIARSSGTGGDGINIQAAAHRCTVKNGSLNGFAQGINSITTAARGCVFRDLSAANCTNYGLRAGEGAVLESCRVHDCGGTAAILTGMTGTLFNCVAVGNSASNAIQAGAGSTLSNCAASSNTGTNAFSAGDGSSLSNCAATGNTLTGSAILAGNACPLQNCSAFNNTAAYGIRTGSKSSLTNCTAAQNASVTNGIYAADGSTVTNCTTYLNTMTADNTAGIGTGSGCLISSSTSAGNDSSDIGPTVGMGFDLGGRSVIEHSTSRNNNGNGIRLTGSGVARENNVVGDGTTIGRGITTSDSYNRVEGNNVTGFTNGIEFVTNSLITGGFMIHNTVTGNSQDNYWIGGSTSFGVVIDDQGGGAAVNGNSATSSFGSPNAWANFTY